MVAPRFFANSSSSSTRIPAPSPHTNPSRSLSNGRLARVGSSLRVDSARSAANPPMPIGVMEASDPPAIITSASSRRIISKASPTECADAVHAVQVARLGPRALNRIETCPAARLMIVAGMKKGEMRLGPFSRSSLCSRSMVWKPPMPDAMNTPTRSAMSLPTVRRASSIAICEAAMAYWMKTSIFLTSFLSTHFSGSNPCTSPAIRAANPEGSKCVMGPMPVWPSSSPRQVSSVPMPTGDSRPTPVTTTRLFKRSLPLLLLGVALDVLDGFLHARDLLGVLVGNLDAEFLFEGHDELDRVERVRAEVVHERRIRRHFVLIDTQLLNNDLLDLVCYRHLDASMNPTLDRSLTIFKLSTSSNFF